MGRIRIGTCSWKYESWEGLVYSRRTGIDYLEEYGRRFDTVEIDQWFWSLFEGSPLRLPDPRTAAAYARAVPEDFRFTVKAPNSLTLTHFHRRGKGGLPPSNPHFLSPGLLARLLESLEPLWEKLGVLMLQFEYLNREKMPSQALFQEKLARFLEAIPRGIPLALESRNPNWLTPAFFRFLEEREVAPVFLQGYYLPPVEEVIGRFPATASQTTPPAGASPISSEDGTAAGLVVRLHGPDRHGIEEASGGEWNRILEPRDDELARIAAAVRQLAAGPAGGRDLFLNVNNHYEGSAPLTIEKLRSLLGVTAYG